jgi:hypothetical protein
MVSEAQSDSMFLMWHVREDDVKGFHIDEYPLNKDHWTEGFISDE